MLSCGIQTMLPLSDCTLGKELHFARKNTQSDDTAQ